MNKILTPILLVLIVILIASLGYFIFQNQKLTGQLQQPQVSPSTISTPASSPTPKSSPSPTTTKLELQENIKDAINSGNFAALEGYMNVPTVNFIIMSSECCGPQTPQETIAGLAYIKDGVPMDFNQQNENIKNLKTKNSRLASAYIGISTSTEHLVAFTIDPQNKISGIEVAVTWKLYEQ